MTELYGQRYTRGDSYRARAEARQRTWRAEVLGAEAGRYGHLLAAAPSAAGENFLCEAAHAAARLRQTMGKGITQRTFENMLSSQAMCFNIFAPLYQDLELAKNILKDQIIDLKSVQNIIIEYTPAHDVFSDQRGLGGVDCDVLIEATLGDERRLILLIETKFVELGFSSCAFRKTSRAVKNQPSCDVAVRVAEDRTNCLYTSKKGYRYWERTDLHDLLRDDALPALGCPFGDQLWQLWVNLALAHEEARRREAQVARFAVCASPRNAALAASTQVAALAALLKHPDAVLTLDLDALIESLTSHASPDHQAWIGGLRQRYMNI